MIEFYNTGVLGGLILSGIVLTIIMVVGLVRLGYKYAMAQDINIDDDVMMSTSVSRWLFYCVIYIEAWWTGEVLAAKDKEEFFGPYGADFRGTLIDMLVAAIAIMLMAVAWPVVITTVVVMVPLYKLHEKNKVKREFIEKLKGEQAEE